MQATRVDSPHYLIIAGEASGDLHGSKLVYALKTRLPKARFTGMGGTRMQEAGVDTLFGIERMGAVGIVEVLGDFDHYYKVYRTLMREIASLGLEKGKNPRYPGFCEQNVCHSSV